MLVHGPGDVQGQPVELDDEQARFILRAYEIDDAGRRVVRRAVFSRPKGRAKSELAAFLACAEGLGPVRFADWGQDGRPLGRPVRSPLVRIAATEEGQAGDTYQAAMFMLQLVWSDGDGFTLEDKPELDDNVLADLIVAAITENPGVGWTKVEAAVKGIRNDRKRAVRDGLLRDRRILNVVKQDGLEVALDHCPERSPARLYLAEDPTISHLRPSRGADGAQVVPLWAEGTDQPLRPAPPPIRAQGRGADPAAPENDSVGAP